MEVFHLQLFWHKPREDVIETNHISRRQELRLSAHVPENDLDPLLQAKLSHRVFLQLAEVLVDLDADNLARVAVIVGSIEDGTKPRANIDNGFALQRGKQVAEDELEALLGAGVGDIGEILNLA